MLEEVYHYMGFIQLHASSWSSFIRPPSHLASLTKVGPCSHRLAPRASRLPTYALMDYDLGTHEHFSLTPLQKIERSNHPTKDCKIHPIIRPHPLTFR